MTRKTAPLKDASQISYAREAKKKKSAFQKQRLASDRLAERKKGGFPLAKSALWLLFEVT